MEIIEKIKLSPAQLYKLEHGSVVEIEATWEEFMAFAETSRFKQDYHRRKIIIMGLAAYLHELLVTEMILLLRKCYNPPEFLVSESNTGISLPEAESYYNADITVIKGLPVYKNNSTALVTNPYLLVEILSESTYKYDFNEKLFQYEKLESLQAILFVDRFEKAVFTFQRTENPKVWIQTIFDELHEQVSIDNMNFILNDLFVNLPENK